MDVNFCPNLIKSMPKRCIAVIENVAYSTK